MDQIKESYDVHGVTHSHSESIEAKKQAKLIQTGRLIMEAATTGLTKCNVKHGDSGLRDDFGGSFSTDLTDVIGTGYKCVTVQISGWYVDFASSDHHINTISFRFRNVSYNPTTGAVTWKLDGWYQDKNGDDDYQWRVWWTIFAVG